MYSRTLVVMKILHVAISDAMSCFLLRAIAVETVSSGHREVVFLFDDTLEPLCESRLFFSALQTFSSINGHLGHL